MSAFRNINGVNLITAARMFETGDIGETIGRTFDAILIYSVLLVR